MPEIEKEQLDKMRHSAAHLLAASVLEIWPSAKPAIGPAIDDGFYYDFEFPETISDADLKKIEKKMRQLLPTWTSFSKEAVSAKTAREKFAKNSYKLELIDDILERNEDITLYTAGSFTDLCRGGHVDRPSKELGAFVLHKIAGAYWRGDEKNIMLTRIYGLLFTTKEELENYQTKLKEAKKRDHRILGQQLDLFTFSPLVGAGLPLFTPRGTIIRRELEEFVQSLQEPVGYERVVIPHITKKALYETSGHWDKFRDDLFKVCGKGETEFVMKPMNCPHHTQIYASRQRSYRDLPIRYSEVTAVYRDEQAGELQGLARVRMITQDDAHVFCTPEQMQQEINAVYDIITKFYGAFDFELSIRLSLWDSAQPERYLGEPQQWEIAQEVLRSVLIKRQADFAEEPGEASFYGPKIDFTAHDALGRAWQLATIQLDFNLPQRFDLTYTDESGEAKRPVMIHRAILGSIERFIAVLLEHYAGRLPLWLSPVQVAILPISDAQYEYARGVVEKLRINGLRAEVDERSLTIGKKIREAELMKIPVLFVVGKKEQAAETIAVRTHEGGDEGEQSLPQIIEKLKKTVLNRQ